MKDNGVLVIVVPNDHRMRIEVGYGLEGTLTDSMAEAALPAGGKDDGVTTVKPGF